MIELTNVAYQYRSGSKGILGINLKIHDGDFVAIIGENGSGKSTLAKIVSGLEKPTAGDVIIDNINTKDKKRQMEIRKKVGIVFQNPENQIIFDRVCDDIAFGLKNLKVENPEARIRQALEQVGMMEWIHANPYELSMGQKQRVAIAGVLALGTNAIIFDEPTSMIDPRGKKEIRKIIKKLHEEGITIIYITNIIEEISLASRVIIIENGTIVKELTEKQVLSHLEFLE